ncbi:hypothetical protein GCM10028808_60070 [Spirosoma migulaei]
MALEVQENAFCEAQGKDATQKQLYKNRSTRKTVDLFLYNSNERLIILKQG